jgi:hypothetical protein
MLRIVAWLRRRARTNAAQVSLHQGHARALHRDVGARPHGDTHIWHGQRRGVVDAVARHRDPPSLRAQVADDFNLPLRQHLGLNINDTEFRGHGLGRPATVAREHHDRQSGVGRRPTGLCE